MAGNEDDAREAFAELELRTIWNRIVSLIRKGPWASPVATPPAYPSGPRSRRRGDERPELAGGIDSAGAWLDDLRVEMPGGAAEAVEAIEQVVAEARAGSGNVAVHAVWSGDPGRSPIVGLVLTAEPSDAGQPEGQSVLYLGDGSGGDGAGGDGTGGGTGGSSLLTDRSVLDALATALGPGGVGAIAHNGKEIMRSLLPDRRGHHLVGSGHRGRRLSARPVGRPLPPAAICPSAISARRSTTASKERVRAPSPSSSAAREKRPARAGTLFPPTCWLPPGWRRPSARLRAPLRAALVAEGEAELYDDIERPLVRVLARMEVTGIPVDRRVLRAIAEELADECRHPRGRIHELAGAPFNVNSVPQLRAVLYDQLGLTPVRKTKTGYSTDARTLEQLRGPASDHRGAAALPGGREAPVDLRGEPARRGGRRTAASTPPSARRWPGPGACPRTGPTCTTSRCAPSRDGGSARRSCPPPGRRLLVADYDQIELRAIAHLSGDPGLGRGLRRRARTSTAPWPPGCSASTATR